MNDDIEIVRDYIDWYKENFNICVIDEPSELQAIERVLARLEQLEKELEPIHKTGMPVEVLLAEWDRLENLEDDTDCLKYRIKELEKENEFWKEYKEKLDKLDTKDFIFKHELENYIPKSVIREKLETIKKIEEKCEKGVYYNPKGVLGDVYCTFVSEVEELLGGSNE